METIWTLIESCIIPIITYGSETWDITQHQTKRLNRILDNIIKRILNLPQPTPRECLYYELGTLDIEHRIIIKRMNYATTLLIKNPDNLRETLQATNPKSWIQKTIQQARSIVDRVSVSVLYTETDATVTVCKFLVCPNKSSNHYKKPSPVHISGLNIVKRT